MINNSDTYNIVAGIEYAKQVEMYKTIDILLSQGRITETEAKEAKGDAIKTVALNLDGIPFKPSAGGLKVEGIILEENRKVIQGIFDKLSALHIGKELKPLIAKGWNERRDLVVNILGNLGGTLTSCIIQCANDTIIVLDTGNKSNLAKYRLLDPQTVLLNAGGAKKAFLLTPVKFGKNLMLIIAGDDK